SDINYITKSGFGLDTRPANSVQQDWLANSASSKWIVPLFLSPTNLAGIYHYRLTFGLCCTNSAQLVGRIAADDNATWFLNNQAHGTILGPSGWTPISLTSGFVIGNNTLDIFV